MHVRAALRRTLPLGLLLILPLQPAVAQEEGALKEGRGAEPPSALELEGVPPIPPSLLEQARRFQEIRSASFLGWHPRSGMLLRSRVGNVDQLYHLEEPGAEPRALTAEEEPVAGGRYLPDGALLFTVGKGGDENFQIYRSGPGSSSRELLTDGRSRHLLFRPDPQGRRIPFSSTRRNGRDADLYLLEAGSTEARLLFEVDRETWSLRDWAPGGETALLVRYVSANESYPYLLEIEGGARRPLPAELETLPPRVSRDALRFGPRGRSVYLTSDARSEFPELVRLDLSGGRPCWLTQDLPWGVEEVEVSPRGDLLAFTLNQGGLSRLFLLDLEAAERGQNGAPAALRREVQLPSCQISGLEFSPAGRRLGFTLQSARGPAEAYSLDLPEGRLQRWSRSDWAGFREEDFVAPEPLEYSSFDGRQVPAFLYLPRPAAAGGPRSPLPVIVSIHGGPEGQFRPGYFSARVQHHLRSLGAAVVAPNVRGSTGYGKSYALLDNGILREDSVRDIGALLDWIGKDPRLDSRRVAVVGGSYGGYMVLASLVHFGDRLRAGVDVVGISSFITLLENTSAYRRDLRRAEYGDERDPRIREFFEKIAPLRRMGDLRSALLVVHGVNDPRVPISEARAIVERARTSGRPVWTLYAANEGHGFSRRENGAYEAAVTAAFLGRHLLDARDAR